jgi:diguanylate cyclase (GGDEF)-like protein/putative nucleotidyltransferase with HDIG domain
MDITAAAESHPEQAVSRGDGADVPRLPGAGEHGNRRILPVAVPVILAGATLVLLALVNLALAAPGFVMLGGLAALLVAALFAEAFPVPLEPAGYVSLTAVFIVGTAVIYGWEGAVVVAFLTGAVIELVQKKPVVRLAYNSSVYALGGAASAYAAHSLPHHDRIETLLAEVLLAAIAFYVVNVVLASAVIARWAGEPLSRLLVRNAVENATPFAIMASVSLMLAVLWGESPFLMAALVGPLVAVALYQRSVHRAMKAMRLALTDAQTGLGNTRHFEELLQRYLDRADEQGAPLTLCLIDVDNFKHVNDTYGHPVGDKVLATVAARLRRGGESFRLGGDEFAILLPGRTLEEGRAIAESVSRRIVDARYEHGGTVSISVGVATYPQEGVERNELVRVADTALYSAKGHGRARVHVYRPDAPIPAAPGAVPAAAQVAGLRAAAAAVDTLVARDVSIGSHSHNVGELAARIALRLGFQPDEADLIRVAGHLHDIGKLLIPETIVHKPADLTAAERIIVERHAEIGFRMLDALGIDPIASWILHHHERWDGEGYPKGLAGSDIPRASRILFVADAYDTMTADRVYRKGVSRAEALGELDRCSGTQFDPAVVAALKDELAERPLELVLPATA